MIIDPKPEYGYIPPVIYFVLCVFTKQRQMQLIPDRRISVLDVRMATNLTLAGFSFTVISLIVTLYQEKFELLRIS